MEYIEMEKELLPAAPTAKPIDGIVYDAGFAAATVAESSPRGYQPGGDADKIKYAAAACQNRALSPTPVRRRGRGHLLGDILRRAADTFAKKAGVVPGCF